LRLVPGPEAASWFGDGEEQVVFRRLPDAFHHQKRTFHIMRVTWCCGAAMFSITVN